MRLLEKLDLVRKLEPDTELLENLDIFSNIVKSLEGLSKKELFNRLRNFREKDIYQEKLNRILNDTYFIIEDRELCEMIKIDYLNNNTPLIIQTALYSFFNQINHLE